MKIGCLLGRSIRMQLQVMVLIVLVAVTAIIVSTGMKIRTDAVKDAENIALDLACYEALSLERFVEGTHSMLVTLAETPQVQARDVAACNRLFANILKKNPAYNSLQAALPDGSLFSSAIPLPGRVSITDRKYYRDALSYGDFSVGEYIIGRTAKKPMLNFAFPVLSPERHPIAILQAGCNLEQFSSLLQLHMMREDARLIVTDHRGTVLFRSGMGSGPIGTPDDRGPYMKMVGAATDEGVFYEDAADGGRKLHAYKRLRLSLTTRPYFFVRVEIPEERIVAGANHLLLRNLLLLVGIGIFSLFFAGLIVRRITGTLQRLVESSRQLAVGTYDISLPSSDYREVEQLNENFAAMVQAVEVREQQLEEQYEELAATEEELRQQVEAFLLSQEQLLEEKDKVRNLNQDLELRVAERTSQLERLNRELEAFSYSVSHDLRTPLRHMSGFSRIVLEDYRERLDTAGVEHLCRIVVASERMERLIDDLLELSRVVRSEMRFMDVDLGSCARTVFATLRETEPERRVDFSAQEGLIACGDPVLLNLVMENLLANAWKYTSKTEHAVIRVGKTEIDGRSAFFVSDNGAGFDMQYADRLFGAFQRLHGSEFEGTGIGLATVQRIVHRHGGEVWAEGETGKGAVFSFSIASMPRQDSSCRS
ncbi:MAG: HAMP domain-containing protein [Geobacter sp.]|nr:HAMP domain-containing protein [Geobacter sp.]